MDEKVKKQKFLQLQFGMLLLVCTLLPDWGSLLGIPGFDFPVFCCKLAGFVMGGTALYAFYKSMGESMPNYYLALSGGGIILAMLSMLPDIPSWFEYLGLVGLLVALFLSRGCLSVEWKNAGSHGAYLVLLAILLHVYDGIGDSTMTAVAALIGLILYFMGLGKMKETLDADGIKGVSRLKIAVVLSIVAVVFGWIPLLGGIIAGILLIIAFIIEYMGYSAMKRSVSLGEVGQKGAGKLCISMIILLLASIIDLFPLTGMIVGIILFIALWLVFRGWNMILDGMESDIDKN